MFKLVRKVLFFGVIGGAAALLMVATGAWRYLTTAADVVKNEVKGNIPIEFEIKRAEALIEGIGPEIATCRRVVATEEVEVCDLQKEIVRLEQGQEKALRKISVQRTALKSGDSTFVFSGINYRRPEVEADLEKTFDAYRNCEELVASKKRLLQARHASLTAARHKLDQARVERTNLDSVVQTLYAKLRQLQATESTGRSFQLDTSRLAQAKELLKRCEKRLEIAQKLIDQENTGTVGIEVETPVRKSLAEEVDHMLATRAQAPGAEVAPVELAVEARR
jgi:chromosome segregation ATPase